jgi:hypothetical protein
MLDLLVSSVAKFRLVNDRVTNAYGNVGDQSCGAFLIPRGTVVDGYKAAADVACVAAAAAGWDHVSLSCKVRCPVHAEVMLVHRLFFGDEQSSMQLQMPKADHINNHPWTVHIWRPWPLWGIPIPFPPKWMV